MLKKNVTFMSEVSSSKPLGSESKGFAFWVELVASGLPSEDYLSCMNCKLLHRSEGFTLNSPRGFPLSLKKRRKNVTLVLHAEDTHLVIYPTSASRLTFIHYNIV